ncbi:MAG: putative heme d1 biosynthesis radical SAM protein NirJ2 [Candidatus Altimarinota bacterium]
MKKIAYLQLHRICDQECVFCAQPSNGSVLDFKAIKKQIDAFVQDGYSKVIFSGGEPSLNKDFFEVIAYGKSLGIEMTILSNGHRFSEYDFAKKSVESGLLQYHISLHSHISDIHDALVKKPGSLKRCFQALHHLLSLSAHITINITINAYNVSYFDRLIKAILKEFPSIHGFIINNLETSQIPREHYSVIAKLSEIKKTIPNTLQILENSGKKFRIERVPFCYIRGYEHHSTDLEYVIDGEEKFLHYLGESRASHKVKKENYVHNSKYGESCSACDLKGLCAGQEGLNIHYFPEELIPQTVSEAEKKQIIQKFYECYC